MERLISQHIPGLFQGVSRQPGLVRSPNQLDELVNLFPSVDAGGATRCPGTRLITSLDLADYSAGPHHIFTTTDTRRWALLRKAAAGQFAVVNLETGALAALTVAPAVSAYIAGANLRYLTISDTTLILNQDVTVQAVEDAVPALTAVYVVIRRVTTAQQNYTVTAADGAIAAYNHPKDNASTREYVAAQLATKVNIANFGVTASVVGQATNVIKIVGPTAILEGLQAENSYDSDAILCIKGRVSATSYLPAAFDDGAVVMVDANQGDAKTAYYVKYSRKKAAWIECSYTTGASTARMTATTLPVQLKQTGDAAFSLDVATWGERTKGDSNTNPMPFFVGKKINDITLWKGRLWVASQDTLSSSQPDDLFNFFKETARESRAADPVELPSEASTINHIVPFAQKLMALTDTAQLEVPGDKPITPESATIGVVTRYNLDPRCQPVVVGSSLYFAGTADGRSALWEYFYDLGTSNNTAFDLSKHVPGYVAGRPRKIAGVPQAGRLFVWTPDAPATLYNHTSYWNGQERAQNAWATRTLQGIDVIRHFGAIDDRLYILATSGTKLVVLWIPMDAQGELAPAGYPLPLPFIDLISTPVWGYDSASGKWRIPLPPNLKGRGAVIRYWKPGWSWWAQPSLTTETNGELWTATDLTGATVLVGMPLPWALRFSPFYAKDEQGNIAGGRFQVRRVSVDFAQAGDVGAVIRRDDRPQALTHERTARTAGADYAIPVLDRNVQFHIPFNSEGANAELTLAGNGSSPITITGYTLTGRYSNPYA